MGKEGTSSQDLHFYMGYCGNGGLGRVICDSLQNQNAKESFLMACFYTASHALYRFHGADLPEVGKTGLRPGQLAKDGPLLVL